MNYEEIVAFVRDHDFDKYLLVHDAAIDLYNRAHSEIIKYDYNVFWMSRGLNNIIERGYLNLDFSWPRDYGFGDGKKPDDTLEGHVVIAIANGWNVDVHKVMKVSDFSIDKKNFSEQIGVYSGDTKVILNGLNIIRKP